MIATRTRTGPATSSLRWRVDPARSEASVLGEHMGAAWVNGLVKGFVGVLLLDPSDPCGCSFAVRATPADLYIGEPHLNTRLRLEEILPGDGEIHISGVVSAGALPGELHAEVHHTLPGLASPLQMAVELRSSSTLTLAARQSDPAWSWRVNLTARPLEGLERLHLHLEAELEGGLAAQELLG